MADPLNELTEKETVNYRMFELKNARSRHGLVGPRKWTFGLFFQHRGPSAWRAAILLGPVGVALYFQTYAAYRHALMSLGPYRNA